MTDTNDDIDRTLSTNHSILIPVSTDKVPLLWDGNDANILGLLYETGRYYTNKGIFQTLLRHRAVSLSNGKLAVEHPSAVYFVTGQLNDPHDINWEAKGKKTGLVMPRQFAVVTRNASRVSTTCEAGVYELGHALPACAVYQLPLVVMDTCGKHGGRAGWEASQAAHAE